MSIYIFIVDVVFCFEDRSGSRYSRVKRLLFVFESDETLKKTIAYRLSNVTEPLRVTLSSLLTELLGVALEPLCATAQSNIFMRLPLGGCSG